ncbi:MAG: rhomboid family intramembrane serine protease [Planctomycetes bacterium]|nr:rhomboid family intramembrane serine protease [Planctomycetota bacterium]
MFIPLGIRFRELVWPTGTIALIICNVLMFAAQQFLAPSFQLQLLLRPDRVDPVAWLTSMFMHADLMHLLGNMVFLWPFGMYLESRLGWQRLILLYLASGVGAGLTFLALHWGEHTPALGASGAIAGLMGLCVVAAPLGKLRLLPVHPAVLIMAAATGRRRGAVVFPLVAWVMLWVASQEAYAWAGVEGIAFAAHFGGITLGVLLGLAMRAKVLPEMAFEGPATEEEALERKRERFVNLVAAAWAGKPRATPPPVDYMRPRAPNWHDKPDSVPPILTGEVDDPV